MSLVSATPANLAGFRYACAVERLYGSRALCARAAGTVQRLDPSGAAIGAVAERYPPSASWRRTDGENST